MHAPEPIGMFAGSLLARVDWGQDWRARNVHDEGFIKSLEPFTDTGPYQPVG